MKCSKHKKYTGKKKPKYECLECLNLYFVLKKPRSLPKPTKVFKDKKKYNRKKEKKV